jgi:predicted DCC family thiol-disulfide oxidoreductase YuxK
MKNSRIQGWLPYDGSCGFCSRWVPFWENTLRKRGFHIAPLQSAWVVEKLKISQEQLAADLRLLLTNGEQLRIRSLSIFNAANLVGHAFLCTLDLADFSNFIRRRLPGVCRQSLLDFPRLPPARNGLSKTTPYGQN